MKTRRKAYSGLTNELAALPKDNIFTGNNTFNQGIDIKYGIMASLNFADFELVPNASVSFYNKDKFNKSVDIKSGSVTIYNKVNDPYEGTTYSHKSITINYGSGIATLTLPEKSGTLATLGDVGGMTVIYKDYVQGGSYSFTADEMTQIVNNFDKTVICIKVPSAYTFHYYLYPLSQGSSYMFASSGVPFGQGFAGSTSWRLSISGTAGNAGSGTVTNVEAGGGGGTAGVSSIGGATGAITLGDGLTMTSGKLTPKIKNIYVGGGFLNIETN